jgi:hypothetical protein
MYMYYNNMRDSGLPLCLCSPTPPTTRSQTCGYVTRVAVNVPGVTSVLHELRDLTKVTRKSAKTYTCQKCLCTDDYSTVDYLKMAITEYFRNVDRSIRNTLSRNMVYPALLPLIRTTQLPVVDWTDAPCRFKWTHPFRRKTKSGFCACAITLQAQSTAVQSYRGQQGFGQ